MIYDLQKASLMKRISAFLLDFILTVMLFTGCMLLVANITNYDANLTALEDRLISIQEKYGIEELEKQYEIKFTDYQYMFDEEIAAIPQEVRVVFDACNEEMNTDAESIKLYETIMTLSILIVSISMLISFIVLEFVIPLILGNGQTLGKKMFSIAVMRVDCVKITPQVLFIRSILGKYTISTMVPLIMLLTLLFGSTPLMPLIVIVAIFLIQIILLIVTKTNSLIHDSLASTVVVDLQSQMIFDTVEAKNEYVLRLHKESVDKADY
ncbi:MAG: RDD family protein [Clostridia bacterium]|nr:RDD family protein [Clostridia bacterium]